MLATVQRERDQQGPKNVKTPRSTAFVVAGTMRNPTPETVQAKAALFEKMNAIAAEEDPKKQRTAWNEVKSEYAAMKAAPEGILRT